MTKTHPKATAEVGPSVVRDSGESANMESRTKNGLHVLRRRSPAATLSTDNDHETNRPYMTSCGAASRVTRHPGGSRGERGEALIKDSPGTCEKSRRGRVMPRRWSLLGENHGIDSVNENGLNFLSKGQD